MSQLWGIDSCNRANRKLAEPACLANPAVAQAIRDVCAREGVEPAGDAQQAFKTLFEAVAMRTIDDGPGWTTQSNDWKRQAYDNHRQMVCERLAAEILAMAGVEYEQ